MLEEQVRQVGRGAGERGDAVLGQHGDRLVEVRRLHREPGAVPVQREVVRARQQVRGHRDPVVADNPFLQAQGALSDAITDALDRYRDHRDEIYRIAFETIYGSPWMQALAGQGMDDDAPPRPHPV